MIEVNIKTLRSRNEFRGYQKYLENMLRVPKKVRKNSGGVVDVNFEKPSIYQLFSEAQGIIDMVNAVIKPLLKLFSAG